MRRHRCGEDCPTCQDAGEEREYGIERDDGMADLMADRYEKDVLGL